MTVPPPGSKDTESQVQPQQPGLHPTDVNVNFNVNVGYDGNQISPQLSRHDQGYNHGPPQPPEPNQGCSQPPPD